MQGTHAGAERYVVIEPAGEHKGSGEPGTPASGEAEEVQCRKVTEHGLVDEREGSHLGDGEGEEEAPQDTERVTCHCARRGCDQLAGHTRGNLEEHCVDEQEVVAVPARPLEEGVNAYAAQRYGREEARDHCSGRGRCD